MKFQTVNMKTLRDRLTEPMMGFLLICQRRPLDALAFTFLNVATILTYLLGSFHIAPVVFEGAATWKVALFNIYGGWIFIAIFSNIYLIRKRDSSIRNKVLPQPNIKLPPVSLNEGSGKESESGDGDLLLNERTKYIGQQFMARPFGDDESWHICATCEIFVPPRAWHCMECRICVLRRDHHCVFTMACIGIENHANFLSMLLYIAIGASSCTVIYFIHEIYYMDVAWWWCVVKLVMPFYSFIYEFSIITMLGGTVFLGQFSVWVVLVYYIVLAMRGQTSADKSRGISRKKEGVGKYENLQNMLGPNPIFNILWPFHKVPKITYESVASEEQELKVLSTSPALDLPEPELPLESSGQRETKSV